MIIFINTAGTRGKFVDEFAWGINMKSDEDELSRLQSLRDQQIRDRDPTASKTAQYRRTVANYNRQQKKITLTSVISDMPAKFWYMIIGGLLGGVLALILTILVDATWVTAVGWIAILFGVVSGRVMGATRDWGDEDWRR
jgi:hypothetical protein